MVVMFERLAGAAYVIDGSALVTSTVTSAYALTTLSTGGIALLDTNPKKMQIPVLMWLVK